MPFHQHLLEFCHYPTQKQCHFGQKKKKKKKKEEKKKPFFKQVNGKNVTNHKGHIDIIVIEYNCSFWNLRDQFRNIPKLRGCKMHFSLKTIADFIKSSLCGLLYGIGSLQVIIWGVEGWILSTDVSCAAVMGRRWIICYYIVERPIGCGVWCLDLLGFLGSC